MCKKKREKKLEKKSHLSEEHCKFPIIKTQKLKNKEGKLIDNGNNNIHGTRV